MKIRLENRPHEATTKSTDSPPNWREVGAQVTQGYGSLANLPVVLGGKAIGILNLMAGRGHFTERRIAALDLELPLAALAILTSRTILPTLAF